MTGASTFTQTAKQVIDTEARALDALGASLGPSFDAAVELLITAKGRIIVSGMGKSGHIARKLAATFASTGTPAHFVHPAEASHGDLGMMTKGDVVVVLSNSGETPELADLVAYTRRFGIAMIGIASQANSALLSQSDVAIVLPRAAEACGTGVVPTTSTTMTLALGDALAVVLMKHRAFSPDNFRDIHPGGKLGAKLIKAGDLMHGGDSIPLVTTTTPMSDTLLTISQKGFGVVGVTDTDGYLAGIITDGDLRRNMTGLLDMTAGDVMTAHPTTIRQDTLAAEAIGIMEGKITCLLVTQGAKPVGILHIHDCLRAGVV